MKRTTISLSALLVLSALLALTSCKKEEMGKTEFYATMEDCTDIQNPKTVLDGTALKWTNGDRIAIYGTESCGIYSATPQTPATTAVFDYVSGVTGNPIFRAFYPTTLTTEGVNITLPATQTFVENSIREFPMYAESSSNTLSFRNLCGVLKLHLTASVNISAISITAANEINGTFSVSYNSGDPLLTHLSGGGNTTTLACATTQSIASGKDFFIYLPAGEYTGLRIELNTDDGRYCVKTANTTISVTRSQYTLITLGESSLNFVEPLPQQGTQSGLFSVSATQQVRFSQGNLQYQASTNTWRFAEHQYDYVGNYNSGTVYENGVRCDNNLVSANYTGWIDLFGWGTGNNPTLNTYNASDYSTFVDWGVNNIMDGTGVTSSGWRTLTMAEWNSLLSRHNSTNLPTPYANFASANVSGIFGLILFPDEYQHPSSVTAPVGINQVVSSTGYYNNYYTLSQWAMMEAAGAVFLPRTGYRNFASISYTDGEICIYWTSTTTMLAGYLFSYTLRILTNQVDDSRYSPYVRLAVRLVRDEN